MNPMNVLVIGQGGREHALVRALKQSKSVGEVHALPGSDGIALMAQCHLGVDVQDVDAVAHVISLNKIELVIIGPEVPLANGLSDALRARDVAVMGPSKDAARLESSKIFSKEFMISAGVPTARSQVVSTVEETLKASGQYAPPYVLKADGLAAGKGVYICKTREALEEAARDLFEKKVLGSAGDRGLLEEFSPGFEISYLILTNGESFVSLPLAQDHKRLLDNDEGPNTGGMGVVAPVPLEKSVHERIIKDVLERSVDELKRRRLLFRGVLFVGLMMTPEGPSVLEYNTRFGDPETQVLLPLLDGDWLEVLNELAHGRVTELKWKSISSACVVLAASGYPDHPVKGAPIEIPANSQESKYLLHAGTERKSNGWVTSGGRVLNAVGLGATLREAIENAYDVAKSVKSESLIMRTDIGRKV